MGNEQSSSQTGLPNDFHAAIRTKDINSVRLMQSTTPDAMKTPPTNSFKRMILKKRAKSVPSAQIEEKEDQFLPQKNPKITGFRSTTSGKEIMSKHMRKAMQVTPALNIVSDIADIFDYKRKLAKGSSCSVLLVQHRINQKMYALKEMNRVSLWNPTLYKAEIKVLKILKDHPNVMTYFDCYIDEKCLYIASEFCSGGTLLDRIIKLKVFTEEIAAKYIATILNAVDYMHERNVCHRDLKLNNIVFDKNGNDATLKLIDFGDALIIADDETNSTFVGTVHYFPPEMLCKTQRKGSELRKGDVYSVGVIAYLLLTGCFPFDGKNKDLVKRNIIKGAVKWPDHVKLSADCKDFILALLNQSVKKRPSAKQALAHKWLANASKDDLGDDLKLYQTNFHHSNKLQQILIQAMFAEMSKDQKKFVIDELKKYKQKNVPLTPNTHLSKATSSQARLKTQASVISEQEFVGFMIANHVDEKKAKQSTRNLFQKVSLRSTPKTSPTTSLSKSVYNLLNLDDFLDDLTDQFFEDKEEDDLEDDILGILQPMNSNSAIAKPSLKNQESSLNITKSDSGVLVLEVTHSDSVDRSKAMFRKKMNLHQQKTTITAQQFKDLLANAPKISNIDAVIQDLDPNNTGIIDLKRISHYSQKIQMCD